MIFYGELILISQFSSLPGKRCMRSHTNIFLVNLAVSDICMALLNCVPSFIFMRDRVWTFGAQLCTMSQFSAYLTISVSVFTLLAITWLRYKVIKS